jgi:hypothetical protein
VEEHIEGEWLEERKNAADGLSENALQLEDI